MQAVFDVWKVHRPNPERVKLTPARAAVIRARLKDGHTVEELSLLVGEYAHTAETNEAQWWRGDNPDGTEYLDLLNLLRVSKTAPRVERAWAWKHGTSGGQQGQEGQKVVTVPDVNLGPLGGFRNPGWNASGVVRGRTPTRRAQ